MKKESIDKTIQAMFIALDNIDIDQLDKFELMKNMHKFLKDYDENIKVLSFYNAKRRYENVQAICNGTAEIDRHK